MPEFVASLPSCIPKCLGKVQVKDLRPISVAPVIMRLFSKWLLRKFAACQDNVPPHSIGGVRGRQSMSAWLPAAFYCERTWRHNRRRLKTIQGVAIDTAKFVDSITFEHAAEALLSIQFPRHAAAAWVQSVKQIKRYPSLNGAIALQLRFSVDVVFHKGIRSPCWWQQLRWAIGHAIFPRQLQINHVFVDDRLLLDENSLHLQEVFDFTQTWDSNKGFDTKPKTFAFGTNTAAVALRWNDGSIVRREDANIVLSWHPSPVLERFA